MKPTIVLAMSALFLAGLGCESTGRHYTLPPPQRVVPEGARLAAAGVAPISASVAGPGSVYVLDDSRGALVYSSALPGDSWMLITLDPQQKQIIGTPADAPAQRTQLGSIDPSHRYSIWVQGGSEAADHGAAAPTTQPAGSR